MFSDASLSLIEIKQQPRRLPSAGVALGDVDWARWRGASASRRICATTEAELEARDGRGARPRGPSLIEARIDPSGYGEMLRAVRG